MAAKMQSQCYIFALLMRWLQAIVANIRSVQSQNPKIYTLPEM